MRRVLVTGAARIGKAGVATIVYKWGQEFDHQKLIYDYLMQSGLPDEAFRKKIKEKGSIMYTLPHKKRNWVTVIKWVETIIRKKRYAIIHINSDSAYIAAAYIFAAKRGGIKRILVHSHCTKIDDNNLWKRIVKTLLHKICMPYVCANSDSFLACSEIAGEWMFGRKGLKDGRYRTIYNGVETERYLFNPGIREKYRKMMSIEDKYVICNIGRFSYQKNHRFLLEIFRYLHEKIPQTVLLLIGEGELEEKLKTQAKELFADSDIKFLGVRDDVHALLSAADCLVMPSRFEGLPVTLVEAQMADLPCVVSGAVTREAKFTEHVSYIESWNLEEWCGAIEKYRNCSREGNAEDKRKGIFNIQNAVKELEKVLTEISF